MTTLYHTLFVDRMYSLEHNNMTAAPVIKGNTSGFLPTGASLSISKWRLREIGVYGSVLQQLWAGLVKCDVTFYGFCDRLAPRHCL